MIVIDGSQGEGGGQVLRSAVSLSMCSGQPFRIEKIRAGRSKPGLMRQHLTAVKAAAEVCGATITGDAVGSTELSFTPGRIRGGSYRFAVGTAGSCTLVLQTLLPALLAAGEPSTVVIEGGTHNPFAPPFDFLEKCYLPALRRMGACVTVTLEKPGFYPAGGGRIAATVETCGPLRGFELVERGPIVRRAARALVANLPDHVGERELAVVEKRTGWERSCFALERVSGSVGPGNVLAIELESSAGTEVITAFGETGVTAEFVADKAVEQLRRYLPADVPVGEHLADQLMLPLAVAATSGNGGGVFRTLPLSRHARTQIDLLRSFLDVKVEVERESEMRERVVIG